MRAAPASLDHAGAGAHEQTNRRARETIYAAALHRRSPVLSASAGLPESEFPALTGHGPPPDEVNLDLDLDKLGLRL
jgi:hypothetical protein